MVKLEERLVKLEGSIFQLNQLLFKKEEELGQLKKELGQLKEELNGLVKRQSICKSFLIEKTLNDEGANAPIEKGLTIEGWLLHKIS